MKNTMKLSFVLAVLASALAIPLPSAPNKLVPRYAINGRPFYQHRKNGESYEHNGAKPILPSAEPSIRPISIGILPSYGPPVTFPTLTPTTADSPVATGTGTGTAVSSGTGILVASTITELSSSSTFSQPETTTSAKALESTAETTSVPALTSPVKPSSPGPTDVLRGVNIGNWLIVEKWMDHDGELFGDNSAVDQFTLDSTPNSMDKLKKHWDTWFQESDVQKLKSYGFNALRIPIGYWAFESSPPYNMGAADYMDKAIGWARTAGMKVMVDCHGSPGSQNGKDHSGHEGSIKWQEGDNLNASTRILQTMLERYGGKDNSDIVFGLEIVNEPQAGSPNDFSTSKSWATTTYDALQQTIKSKSLNPAINIITHDSFMGPTQFVPLAQDLTSPVQTKRTFSVDQHNYQLYTDADNALTQPQHIQKACAWGEDLAKTKATMPVYVGEWSALTKVCVKQDGSTVAGDSCSEEGCSCSSADTSKWSQGLVEQVRKYVEAQLDTFEANSNGWFLWSYGGPGGWGVDNLIDVGAFPNPVTERKFGGQCGK